MLSCHPFITNIYWQWAIGYLRCFLVLPCPRELTLERQLTNSIVISWKPPLNHAQLDVKSYHVYADGVFKSLVRKNERTKALLENMDSKEVRNLEIQKFLVNNIVKSVYVYVFMWIGKNQLFMRFIIFMYWKLHVIINVKQYISPFIIHWGYKFVEFRQIIFN